MLSFLTQHSQWMRLKAELHANPRLQLGGWAILLLLLFVAQLELNSWQQAQQRQLQQLEQQISDLEHLQAEGQSLQLLETRQAQLQQVQSRHWQARTEGLAQANVRQALQSIQAPNWETRTVEVTSLQPTSHPQVWRLRGRFQGIWQRQLPVEVLDALYQHQPQLELREVQIRQARRNGSLEVQFELLVYGLQEGARR